jgi:hypothetical protein
MFQCRIYPWKRIHRYRCFFSRKRASVTVYPLAREYSITDASFLWKACEILKFSVFVLYRIAQSVHCWLSQFLVVEVLSREALLFLHTVIHVVSIRAQFGTCTVVSVHGTLVEDKMRTFKSECAQFTFNKCPIIYKKYTPDGASAKFSTNSHETDNNVQYVLVVVTCTLGCEILANCISNCSTSNISLWARFWS